jgi:hypothetical protein
MFSTALLAGGGVADGFGVNVHVAVQRVRDRAPACSGESKTTVATPSVLPDEHGGMSW